MAQAKGVELRVTAPKPRAFLLWVWLKGFWGFTRRKPVGGISAIFIVLLGIVAAAAPLVAPHDPDRAYLGYRFFGPGTNPPEGPIMLFGADQAARDLFSRVVYGSRVALQVGIVAVAIGVVSGTVLGIVSGYFGGKTDLIIQRVVDSIMAFPALILALLIMALLGASTVNAMIAIGIVLMPVTARVVRGSTLSVKENPYIDSARAIGAGHIYIMSRYIFPNVAHTILIIAAAFFAGAVLTEASLSFLGIGTSVNTPSWGVMIAGPGRSALQNHIHILIAPAVALSLTVLAFNLLGDALRDVWDPRLRNV